MGRGGFVNAHFQKCSTFSIFFTLKIRNKVFFTSKGARVRGQALGTLNTPLNKLMLEVYDHNQMAEAIIIIFVVPPGSKDPGG